MKSSKYCIAILFCFLFVSCKYDIHQFFFRRPTIDERASSLKEIASPIPEGKEGSIRFAIITDLHFGSDKPRMETEAIMSLADRKPLDFLVLLGDVVETGFEEYFYQCEVFVDRLKGFLALPSLPVYVVLGNHDLYYNGFDRWKKLDFSWNQGENFFRFRTAVSDGAGNSYARSWYFMDTASGVVGTRQLAALSDAMDGDSNPKMVFSHYPLYVDKEFSTPFKLSDPRERARLITLFDKAGVDMVFSGHWHGGGFFDYGRFSELCCASFVENKDISSWYFLTLDEVAGELLVEQYQVGEGNRSSSTQTYSLVSRKY